MAAETTPIPTRPALRRPGLVLAYVALCALSWLLYTMAGAEWQRGGWKLAEAAWEATFNLWPAMALGGVVYPWVRWLRRGGVARQLWHLPAALAFGVAWHAIETAVAWGLFGADHALAVLQELVLWRAVIGIFVYAALAAGFSGVLHARAAQDHALAAARAEAARVRAELAVITGKLNPHFLFNTLNTLLALTRRDAAAAEDALLRFSRLMRHVLDSQRGGERVTLREELDFVRDYLALEALRLGERLRVEWAVDEAVLDEALPPLTLQPLVENSIVHAIAPRVAGGTVRIEARAEAGPGGDGLRLVVADDGPGCAPERLQAAAAARRSGPRQGGVALDALRRRFELDYDGRATLAFNTAPGSGFRAALWLPLAG